MNGEPAKRFTLSSSQSIRDIAKAQGRRLAGDQSQLQLFIASLRELDYRLSFEADEWGESREYLPGMKVQMRCGHCGMLTCVYGINEANTIVFVKSITLSKKYR